MNDLKGVDRLIKTLNGLERQISGPIAIQAVKAGLAASYKAIRPLVGKASKTLRYRVMARKRRDLVEGIIGIGVGSKATKQTRYLPTLVTGTEQRFRKTKSGKTAATGRIIGNNGVAIGMAAGSADAAAAMEASIKKSLSRLSK
jgi:hypothetical protein